MGDHFPVAPAGHPARSLRIDRGDGGRDGLPLAHQGIAHLLTVLGHLTIVAYAAVLPCAMSGAAPWWLGCRYYGLRADVPAAPLTPQTDPAGLTARAGPEARPGTRAADPAQRPRTSCAGVSGVMGATLYMQANMAAVWLAWDPSDGGNHGD